MLLVKGDLVTTVAGNTIAKVVRFSLIRTVNIENKSLNITNVLTERE